SAGAAGGLRDRRRHSGRRHDHARPVRGWRKPGAVRSRSRRRCGLDGGFRPGGHLGPDAVPQADGADPEAGAGLPGSGARLRRPDTAADRGGAGRGGRGAQPAAAAARLAAAGAGRRAVDAGPARWWRASAVVIAVARHLTGRQLQRPQRQLWRWR
ncbi:unnamed protein product, partial [Phaeothamnion confervicola]